MEDTLFNEKFDFFALKMHQKLSYDRTDDVTAEISEAFQYSRYDFMYSIDFSIDTHLNLCTGILSTGYSHFLFFFRFGFILLFDSIVSILYIFC